MINPITDSERNLEIRFSALSPAQKQYYRSTDELLVATYCDHNTGEVREQIVDQAVFVRRATAERRLRTMDPDEITPQVVLQKRASGNIRQA